MIKKFLTSESVTEGHPDKICDQISDGIVDALLLKDPKSRVAVETMVTKGMVIIAGEITTRAYVEIPQIARDIIKRIGYTDPQYGFDYKSCGVEVIVHEQSSDIARGVSKKKTEDLTKLGAGDQGLMYAYATNETPEYMPLPIVLAHKLVKQLAKVRKNKTLPYLRPDGKSQITAEYANGAPKHIKNIVIAAQHDPDVTLKKLRADVKKQVIDPIIPHKLIDSKTKYFINATGRFVLGGPAADTGITGRKIIVDTYGGVGSHGGGAFCVAGDSIINTEHGLGKIKELVHIKRGELIKTDISPAPIGQWVDNGEMDTLTIITQDGYELEGTPTQRIRVIDSEGNYIWRRFDKLQSTDWIAIQKKNRLFGNGKLPEFIFEHKPSTHRKNSFSFPKNLNEDYAYLMGLLIGDGRCTTRDGVQVCVCEKQMEIIVQDLFKRLFGKKGKIFGHWAFFCGVELRAFLQHLGVDRLRSWRKQVPKSIWTAPKPVVAAFLRGLFDTDGTTRRTGRNKNSADIRLSTASKKLAKGIQQLLLNFGIISHIQTVDATGKKSRIRNRIILSSRPIYHLRIKGYASVNIFYKEINFALPRKAKILNDLMNDGRLKRNLLRLPNQHQRVKRLWDKLSSREHQKDPANIGRLLRIPITKGTKELTYEKLEEFLNSYENRFAGDTEFEYLRMLYIMNHYYTRMKSFKTGRTHVYDFTVPGVHTFTANGFVCHNSGKDPTKVDRSGSYGARWVAKNLVASGLCDNVEIQIAYSIGIAKPLSINIDTYGTGKLPDDKLITLVKNVFDLRPGMLIKNLKLRRPIYQQVAAYGHFGRNDLDLPWEKLNKVDELKKLVKTM